MASSGSVDFTINRDQILEGAYQVIGVLAQGQTMTAQHISDGSLWLNMVVKQWQGMADFAPGLKVWSRKRGYMFLQYHQHEYSLGPSGDHATSTYYQTTISSAEAAGQTTISVTSTTSMTAADKIGIVMNSGGIHWSTISSTGAGPVVVIADALAGAAAAGNVVFWYTTKMRRPIQILTAELRYVNGSVTQDTPIDMLSLDQYESIAVKNTQGTPTAVFYEAQLTNGVLYTNAEPVQYDRVIRFVFLSNIEDFDSATDTPDYPQEYLLALVMETAKYLAPVYGACLLYTSDAADE